MLTFQVLRVIIIVLFWTTRDCCAFVQPISSLLTASKYFDSSTKIPTSIFASAGDGGGLFGQNSILGNLFGSGGNNNNIQNPKTLMQIPAKTVKIGALRFVLQIHLVGEQNKPVPKSWMIRQGDESGDLQIYYSDGSGMLSIQLQEYGITFQRHGERPSLQYQLQESVLLHSVLDELSNVAFGVADDNIDVDKRLLILQDSNAIDVARNKLPTRQA